MLGSGFPPSQQRQWKADSGLRCCRHPLPAEFLRTLTGIRRESRSQQAQLLQLLLLLLLLLLSLPLPPQLMPPRPPLCVCR